MTNVYVKIHSVQIEFKNINNNKPGGEAGCGFL